MAEFPALPIFTDAFLADTLHLDATEAGAYLLLLMAAWRTPECALPDDPVRLARMARCDTRTWNRISGTILGFWQKGEDNLWRQKRLSREREFVSSSRQKKVAAAHAANEAKKNAKLLKSHNQGFADGYRVESQPTPTPTPTPNKNKEESLPPTPLERAHGSIDLASLRAVTESWNRLAEDHHLTPVQRITDLRRTLLVDRLHEIGGLEGWRTLCDLIRQSPYLLGQNDRGWQATFDWVIQPANCNKIMEQTYVRRAGNGNGPRGARSLARAFDDEPEGNA